MVNELRDPGNIGGDHWNFHRHGFHQNVGYAVPVSIVENIAREGEDGTFFVDLSQLFLGDGAIHENCILEAQLFNHLLDEIRVFVGLADQAALKGVAFIFQ